MKTFLCIIVLFFLLVVFLINILKKIPEYAYFYLIFLFSTVWKAVSIIYLETGKFSKEINQEVYYSSHFWHYIMLVIPFFLVSYLIIKKRLKHNESYVVPIETTRKAMQNFITIGILAIVFFIYLFMNIFISYGTIAYGIVNRFTFHSVSRLPMISFIQSSCMYCILFYAGKYYVLIKKRTPKILCVIILLVAIIYQVLIDQKFSGVFQYFVCFFIYPFYNLVREKRGEIFGIFVQFIKALLPVLGVLFIFVFINYYNNYGTEALPRIQERIFGLQAGAWVGIDRIANTRGFFYLDTEQLSKELFYSFGGGLNTGVGIRNVMYMTSIPLIVENYLASNVLFAGDYLTVNLSYMGYFWGIILSVIVAMIFVLFASYLKRSVDRNNILATIVVLMGYMNFYDFFRVGDFSYLINFKMCGVILILVMWKISGYKQIIFTFNK